MRKWELSATVLLAGANPAAGADVRVLTRRSCRSQSPCLSSTERPLHWRAQSLGWSDFARLDMSGDVRRNGQLGYESPYAERLCPRRRGRLFQRRHREKLARLEGRYRPASTRSVPSEAASDYMDQRSYMPPRFSSVRNEAAIRTLARQINTQTHKGWTIGGGLEHLRLPRMVGEDRVPSCLRMDSKFYILPAGGGNSDHLNLHTLKFGARLPFRSEAAPVVARY